MGFSRSFAAYKSRKQQEEEIKINPNSRAFLFKFRQKWE